MENVVTAQITSSALIAYAMERLKQSKYFPSITAESKKLNRVLMVAASGLAAIGIHLQFDSATGTLIITGLTTAALAHGVWELLRSSVFTQVVYDVVVSKQLTDSTTATAPPTAGPLPSAGPQPLLPGGSTK